MEYFLFQMSTGKKMSALKGNEPLSMEFNSFIPHVVENNRDEGLLKDGLVCVLEGLNSI